MPIVAYVADPVGTVTYLSSGFGDATGLATSAIVGGSFGPITHGDDRARAGAAWRTALEHRRPYAQEIRLHCADGTYRWFLDRAEAMDVRGGEKLWFGTLSDIHERRIAEAALTDRSHFIDRLLDASGDCIKVLDLSANIRSINPSGLKALGVDDFASIRGKDWLGFWSGDDRLAASAALDAARAGDRGHFTGRIPIEGKLRTWDVGITPIFGSDGTPETLLVISRDVSEIVGATRSLTQREERERLLGAALPGVTWTATPDGQLEHISQSVESQNRESLATRLGSGWLETVHPEDRERTRAIWADSIASGDPYETTFRVRLRDGTYRWQLVRALPQRDDDGAIVLWVGVNIDIDERVRADEAREMFVALAENSGDLIAIADHDGTCRYVNPTGRALLGIPSGSDGVPFDLFAGDDGARSTVLPTIASEGRWSGDLHATDRRTGIAIPIAYNAFALTSDRGQRLGMAMIGRDLRERRRLEANMRALAETGAAMHGAIDFASTVANVADAVVSSFASYCIVETIDAKGECRIAAAAQHHAEAVPLFIEMAAERSRLPEHPATRAIERGEATLVTAVSPEWLASIGLRSGSEDAPDPFDFRSMMFVPMRSSRDGRLVGSLAYVRDGSDPSGPYTADDLRFGEEIARRAGNAFDNASAYEHERRIAVTLQEASLPRELPAIDGLRLSAAYRPGDSEATIGGDWYDAFALADGRIVITIGDVLGHGLDAAVTMGKVRQAMQSVALVIDDLDTILAAADRTIRARSTETYATALVGIFDLQRHEFRFASAGHPGPVVRHPDGRVDEVTAYGIMLGLRSTQPHAITTIAVPPGTTLAFFTDGLVEATRDIEAGHARLRTAIADGRLARASDAAWILVERILAGITASDDIAVLVAHVGGANVRGATPGHRATGQVFEPVRSHGGLSERPWRAGARSTERRMVLVILAQNEDVSRSRAAVRDMVAGAGAPQSAVALAELAAGELLTNSITHGAGTTVEVTLQTFEDRAVIDVTNAGTSFVRPPKQFAEILFHEHGRGLALLAALGCEIETHAPAAGRCTVTATIPYAATTRI